MTEEQQISKCLDFYLEFKISFQQYYKSETHSGAFKDKLDNEHYKWKEKFEFSWDDIEDEDYDTKDSPA